MEQRSDVPLTKTQKGWLLFECIPFLFMLALTIFTVAILDNITGAPPPRIFPIFFTFASLYTGWIAIQRVRDLVSGRAVVQVDYLQRAWRSRSQRGPGRLYGRFEQLGTMRLQPKAYVQSGTEGRVRVTYSPASKVVWSLESA